MSLVRYIISTNHVSDGPAGKAQLPDLSYKQMKAIILFQEIYKMKRHTAHTLNSTLNVIYRTLVSVSNNINNNYLANVITIDQYRKYMEKTDELVQLFKNIPRPIGIKQLGFKSHILYLHYQLYELVKTCGASNCYDVFKLFGGNEWDLCLDVKFLKLLDLYNTMFVPVTVKTHLSTPTDEFTVLKYTSFTLSIMLKIHGAELTVPLGNNTIVIKGYFRDDPLNIARVGGTLEQKFNLLKQEAMDRFNDKDNDVIIKYLAQISLRDFVSLDQGTLLLNMTADLKELDKLKNMPKGHVIEEFLKSGIKKQHHMLTLLLLDKTAHPYALSIAAQDSEVMTNLYRILHWSVQKIFDSLNIDFNTSSNSNIEVDESVIPYETRIEHMKASEIIKKKAREKLKEIKSSSSREGNEKAVKYLDGLLRIPFGVYRKEPILKFLSNFSKELNQLKPALIALGSHLDSLKDHISTEEEINNTLTLLNDPCYEVDIDLGKHIQGLQSSWLKFKKDRRDYLSFVRSTLENCIYGQDEAKRSIESVIAQWINGEMTGVVFGFQGYPGTGKTSLAKHGIAQCIRDEDGNTRPFFFISLGGSRGGNTLLGHSYTYVGSQCGKLAECLQTGKVMNPILYFDELDKVSESSCGEEIIRILTHLTDPEQNDHIEDRYFGIDLDLSKALIIFSYNNTSKIDEILLDRIHEIRFNQYNKSDKVHIASKYVLPKILKSLGYGGSDIIFTNDILQYIIEGYTMEAGVRDIKDKLLEIVREINLRKIYNEDEYKLPFTVTEQLVDDILKPKNKITVTVIPPKPQVGWVNGLYATAMGTGGLTVIQVFSTPSDQKYHLELTGKLGDVMKESVKCAKTISWGLLGTDDRVRANEIWRDSAIHIHFPAAGTSKDGPSAGIAITLAVVSYFSQLTVRNYIAMTGEIDLYGNVRPIGGLQCKIEGAQRAGVKIVLIPRENEKEYLEFAKDVSIKVFAVDNISQVIRVCLIGDTVNNFKYPHDVNDETTLRILEAVNAVDLD